MFSGRCGCLRWFETQFPWLKFQILVWPVDFLSLAGTVRTWCFSDNFFGRIFVPYGKALRLRSAGLDAQQRRRRIDEDLAAQHQVLIFRVFAVVVTDAANARHE